MLLDVLLFHRFHKPLFFFFNDTATTEIYTLSLHDALPISPRGRRARSSATWLIPTAEANTRKPLSAPIAMTPTSTWSRVNANVSEMAIAIAKLTHRRQRSLRASGGMSAPSA